MLSHAAGLLSHAAEEADLVCSALRGSRLISFQGDTWRHG